MKVAFNFKAPTFADLAKSKRPKNKVNGKPRMVGDKVRCDCGAVVHQWVLVDVRGIGSINQDWACDGCRSTMEREYAKPQKGHPDRDNFDYMTKRHEYRKQFLTDLGAPQSVLDDMEKIRRKRAD